jgi:hypothetical protein
MLPVDVEPRAGTLVRAPFYRSLHLEAVTSVASVTFGRATRSWAPPPCVSHRARGLHSPLLRYRWSSVAMPYHTKFSRRPRSASRWSVGSASLPKEVPRAARSSVHSPRPSLRGARSSLALSSSAVSEAVAATSSLWHARCGERWAGAVLVTRTPMSTNEYHASEVRCAH